MQPITIRKATARQEESLCRSCYWAHIQRGYRESEEVIACCFGKFRVVPFTVAECTDFSHKNVPTRVQMEEIALIIPTERKRKVGGFSGIGFATESEEEEDLVPDME
jgi:hypothetical protein